MQKFTISMKDQIDEIPYAVRKSILAEIEYGFNEKWKMYRKAIKKLDEQMPDKYYQKQRLSLFNFAEKIDLDLYQTL